MRNKLIGICTISILIISCALSGCKTDEQKESCDTFEALEKASLLIVQGTMQKNDHAVDLTEHEDGTRTVKQNCTFKVEKIIKNEMEQTINVNSEITVNEKLKLVPVKEREREYYIEGYSSMNEGKKYILFLDYSDKEKIYTPKKYGKVPLDAEEELPHLNETHGSKKLKYEYGIQKKISEEVRNKYLS